MKILVQIVGGPRDGEEIWTDSKDRIAIAESKPIKYNKEEISLIGQSLKIWSLPIKHPKGHGYRAYWNERS